MAADAADAPSTATAGVAHEPARRLFFALWPDEAMRQAMAQATRKAARTSGARPVPAGNLHVTLAFLGSVPERRLPDLAGIARQAVLALAGGAAPDIGGSSPLIAGDLHFELTFDHLEHWRAAHLLCAVPAQPPAWIATLAGRLQDLLAESGFAQDLKSSWSVGVNITRPFRPHVTLVRKVHRSPRTIEMQPVTWSFTDFVLVDSKTLPDGSVYTVLERFSMAR